MAQRERAQTDFVPHLPDLLVSVAGCWRSIRDSQTEVDPFGASYEALSEARTSLETLAYHLTGQHGFFALRDAVAPIVPREPVTLSSDGEPF